MSDQAPTSALFVHKTRKLDASGIRAVLKSLEGIPDFSAVFVREAMRAAPADGYEAHWVDTLETLMKCGRQYSIGDEAFRATMLRLQKPWRLAAIQAATVSDGAPLVVAAALAKDGSDASHDALMADFERARVDPNEWGLRYKLKRLSRYAKPGPHWSALEAAVRRELAKRDAATAEQSTAKRLGLNVPLLDLFVHVRGTKSDFSVSLMIWADDRHPNQTSQALGLDARAPKDLEKLPAWLARVTKTERVTWAWDDAHVKTNLRGKYRAAMLAWLRGERPSPVPS